MLATKELLTDQSGELEAERREIILAFNEMYGFVYRDSARSGCWDRFKILKAGVEKAIGREVTNPECAIPDDYKGDGSFKTTFQLEGGGRVTQKEYIPLDYLSQYFDQPFYPALLKSSIPFPVLHPEHLHDRVKLEAYYAFLTWGSKGIKSDSLINFHFAQCDLTVRRELILPV